ncbi:MAG: UDP-N-acetylmuramoyl-L-alanine--D-glutamate ligase [Patescibacteria group bacterium]|jgi:UDP-N-acetylmuramoylalanine--D-glutamate ligase
MNPSNFKGKKITIMGLGTLGGGVGVARYLLKQGAILTITDLRSRKQLMLAINKIGSKNINYVLGKHREQDFKNSDLVIKNPAVSKESKYLKIAKKNNVPIESDASLFFQLCNAPIIGVTGTKGKTTTVALLADILKKAGRHVVLVGHNQISVLDRLNLVKKNSIVIFELSSWRLEILKEHKISPHIAVITNIAEDHLNTYHGMTDYVEAKSNIFAFQKNNDFVFLNKENSYTQKFGRSVRAKRFWFSKKYFPEQNGIYVKNDKFIFRNMGQEYTIAKVSALKIKGDHNVENALAAILIAKILKVQNKYIIKSLSSFAGLQDRMEFVRTLNGKTFYNDTAATIPEATVVALRSFSEKVILIAGGVDKKVSYNMLAREIIKRVELAILLPGTATDKLKIALNKNKYQYLEVKDLKSAVSEAYHIKSKSHIVLFSPGAASFNLFKNEFDRGEKFRQIVRKLK